MKQKASVAACPTSQFGILIVGLISSWKQNERGQSIKKKETDGLWVVVGAVGEQQLLYSWLIRCVWLYVASVCYCYHTICESKWKEERHSCLKPCVLTSLSLSLGLLRIHVLGYSLGTTKVRLQFCFLQPS